MRADDLEILDQITLADLEKTLDRHTREVVEPDRWTAFSWSVSRHGMFERCKRQYYLNYYGARRVRGAKNPVVSAVWWLKQVTTLKLWIGTVIHHFAAQAVRALRDGSPLDEARLPDQALAYYQAGRRASERGAKHDDQWIILFEHVYPQAGTSMDRDAASAAVYDMMRTLLESDAYGFVKSMPRKAIVEVDESYQSFEWAAPGNGIIRVYAVPDVLLRYEGGLTIVDWKTGDVEREGIRDQAGVYRAYAHSRYGTPEDAISIAVSDVGGAGDSVDPPGGVPTLAETAAFMNASIDAMRSRLEDAPHNTAAIQAYPRTDDVRECLTCSFKRACWR